MPSNEKPNDHTGSHRFRVLGYQCQLRFGHGHLAIHMKKLAASWVYVAQAFITAAEVLRLGFRDAFLTLKKA